MNALVQKLGIDRALVHVEKGDVVIGYLVKLDDELDQVRVGLLPEGLLALAEKVVQERRNVVSERVSIQIVVEGVVTVLGLEIDLNVILCAVVACQDLSHLVAEVALHFQHETADSLGGVLGLVPNELLGVRVHAPAGLSRPDRSEDRNAGKETTLGHLQPVRLLGGNRPARVVYFPQYEIELLALACTRVLGKLHRFDLARRTKRKNVETREKQRGGDIRRRKEEQRVAVTKARVDDRLTQSDQPQHEVIGGERVPKVKRQASG
jgi:hypothetical protein